MQRELEQGGSGVRREACNTSVPRYDIVHWLNRGEPGGYQFRIVGDAGDDVLAVLGRLVEWMRRALSISQLVQSEQGLQIGGETVRARIESDHAEHGTLPLLVIDGREVSWEEFGRMLLSFEG